MTPSERADPVVSVVMPTYNRCRSLERALSALAELHDDIPFEVIVVSDGSTDGTHEYLRNVALPIRLTSITQANLGPAAARNRGLREARGEYVLFLDDDIVAEPGLIAAHIAAHRQSNGNLAVFGPMLRPPDHTQSPWTAWEQAMLDKQYASMTTGAWAPTALQFYTGNASVRTDRLLATGGFDERFRRAEDVELAFRLEDLGTQFVYEPSARSLHYADRSFASWRTMAYAYGRNAVIFARDHGRTWVYGFIGSSFNQQHGVIRRLVRRCVAHPRLMAPVRRALELMSTAGGRRRKPSLFTRYCLSGVYAIEYYRGVSDELDDRAQFEALIGGSLSH